VNGNCRRDRQGTTLLLGGGDSARLDANPLILGSSVVRIAERAHRVSTGRALLGTTTASPHGRTSCYAPVLHLDNVLAVLGLACFADVVEVPFLMGLGNPFRQLRGRCRAT